MIGFKKAREGVLSFVKTAASENIRITESLGRILSRDVKSRVSIPSFNNSAMDGYAARSSDIKETPSRLQVIEIIPAGKTPLKKIKKGFCSKIMTGAALPDGADCVIMVENSRELPSGFVKILKSAGKWENVRFAGEDIEKGSKVFSKGVLITPPVMGVLTSVGKSYVDVFKKVKIGFFTTGNEIVLPPKKLKRGEIFNSNYSSLIGAIYSAGASPVWLGHLSDKKNDVIAAIGKGLKKADIIISSGGVSMGDYDIVKDALKTIGADFKFEGVTIKPGRPTSFAVIKDKMVFSLPGNPVSTLVSFELFVKPAIYKMSARKHEHIKIIAKAGFNFNKNDERRHFLRGLLKSESGKYFVVLAGQQGSGILTSMAKSNCLVEIPEGKVKISKGAAVSVLIPLS